MATLSMTQAHRAARNAASITLADTGAGVASIKLYTAEGGTLLATRALAKPCGAVRLADGRIELAQAVDDDLVLADGGAGWGEWCDAGGSAIASGHVTDADGNTTSAGSTAANPLGVGAFVLSGTTGTQLYAGGIVRITTALIG
ncbi:hypothetical protein [Comamonas sp. NLF-1-9]|uniref:hypothetical protein n=1 Tax=Comamonas sp. NLF-1-9 TaxID=2853163 RepID=UPI001C44039F|nr:hypothetical protein [Comamonas sp. NLF-1-9]QXL84087.1 hypothetical protein KUD94_12735 [Comamonas sp. NLF-1-9]